jgi:uncharacterized membrane protein YfcA
VIWLLLPAGVLISILAIFTGLGGGILWLPILLSGFGLDPREAVLCALIIQVAGQGSGTIANLRQGLVDLRLLRQQALFAAPGMLLGSVLARVVRPVYIELALGLLIFFIAYSFLRGEDLLAPGGDRADLDAGQRLGPVAAFGGMLTGFLSVGVGDLLVPLFNRGCGLRMARAVATGVALMLLLSTGAALAHLGLGGALPWRLVLVAIPGVLIGAQVGSRLHHRFSEARFKELFVLLLVFLAAHVTFNAL